MATENELTTKLKTLRESFKREKRPSTYDQIQLLTKAIEKEKQLRRDLRIRQKEIDGRLHALKHDGLAGVQINGRRQGHSDRFSTQPPSPTFHHTPPAPEISPVDDEPLQNELILPSESSSHPDTSPCPQPFNQLPSNSHSTSGLENMTEAESSTNTELFPPSDTAATLNPDLDYSCLDFDWENFDWDSFDFSTVDFQAISTENPWPFPVNF
jgi:hypothetical protein